MNEAEQGSKIKPWELDEQRRDQESEVHTHTHERFTRGTSQALVAVPQDPLPSLLPWSAGTESHRRWNTPSPPGRQEWPRR